MQVAKEHIRLFWNCCRCKWTWAQKINKVPKLCPKCHSAYWNTPKIKKESPNDN